MSDTEALTIAYQKGHADAQKQARKRIGELEAELTEAKLEIEGLWHTLNTQADYSAELEAQLAEAQRLVVGHTLAGIHLETIARERIAELEASEKWEPLPDGIYLDGALAITHNGTDIGLKIDDTAREGDDWVGNYEWLSDCERHDIRPKDEDYRVCRRTQPTQEPSNASE